MGNIITIFKKEMLDSLRDRRTLLTMILVPLLLIPIILSISMKMGKNRSDKAKEKIVRVALIDNNEGAELVRKLKTRTDITIYEDIPKEEFNQLIRDDSLDMALVIEPGFDAAVKKWEPGDITAYYNSTNDTIIFKKVTRSIKQFDQLLLRNRLDSLGTNDDAIAATTVTPTDVYTKSESIGQQIGGFLPYMFVIFCLMGAMYPAIDLFTGEKEKGTIETILSTPVSRVQILLGKMLVVIISGVVSGVLTIAGLYLALKLNPDIPLFLKNIVLQFLTPTSVGLIILMLIPLTTFFAGMLIPISIYAKSFKEAQSLIQPAMFVVFIPLIIGMVPGIKLTALTAVIPVLNVALASREIVAGTIKFGLLGLVFLSLIAFAMLGIFACVKGFGREGNILRT